MRITHIDDSFFRINAQIQFYLEEYFNIKWLVIPIHKKCKSDKSINQSNQFVEKMKLSSFKNGRSNFSQIAEGCI